MFTVKLRTIMLRNNDEVSFKKVWMFSKCLRRITKITTFDGTCECLYPVSAILYKIKPLKTLE